MMLMPAIAGALPFLRQQARSRMTVTVRVESVTVTADPATGADVEAATVVHASLPCRVKVGARQGAAPDVQGSATPTARDELHFEWDVLGLVPGQRAVVTAVGALDHPGLLGNTYRLVEPCEGSQMTAQHWGVESWPQVTS